MPALREVSANLIGGPLDGEPGIYVPAGHGTLELHHDSPGHDVVCYSAKPDETFAGDEVDYVFMGPRRALRSD